MWQPAADMPIRFEQHGESFAGLRPPHEQDPPRHLLPVSSGQVGGEVDAVLNYVVVAREVGGYALASGFGDHHPDGDAVHDARRHRHPAGVVVCGVARGMESAHDRHFRPHGRGCPHRRSGGLVHVNQVEVVRPEDAIHLLQHERPHVDPGDRAVGLDGEGPPGRDEVRREGHRTVAAAAAWRDHPGLMAPFLEMSDKVDYVIVDAAGDRP